MTKDETLKLALDALELGCTDVNGNKVDLVTPAITALRQALAEPKQAPVTLTDYFKKPYAYVDAVDRSIVYVAPARKLWLKEREDKEWREFHVKHQYDIPLYTEDYNYEQQDC